jgi:hypothetical protein
VSDTSSELTVFEDFFTGRPKCARHTTLRADGSAETMKLNPACVRWLIEATWHDNHRNARHDRFLDAPEPTVNDGEVGAPQQGPLGRCTHENRIAGQVTE